MDVKRKVFLIDDHALFRKGVSQIINDDPLLKVVGEASSGMEGLELAPSLQPDIILIDLNMKEMDGLETLRRFCALEMQCRFVVLTVSDAEDDLLEALRSGADGYLLKDLDPEDLCTSLRKVLGGMTVVQDKLTDVLKQALQEENSKPTPVSPDKASLTEREKEILHYLAEGLSNKAIAIKLGISDTTVKVHVKHVLSKLRLTSRLEAVVWAYKQK